MSFFKENTTICIELDETSIRIIATKSTKSGNCILYYDHIDLPEHYALLSNSDMKDEHFVEQLQRLKSIYNLKNRSVNLVVPSGNAILHNFIIDSSLTEWEMSEAIQQEVEQASCEELQDLRIVCDSSYIGEESKEQTIMACGIPNARIERYISIFRQAGLKLAMVTVDALEIHNAYLSFAGANDDEPATILFSGDTHLICLITGRNRHPFIHTFLLSPDELENPLQSVVVVDENTTDEFSEPEETPEFVDLQFVTSKIAIQTSPKVIRYPVLERILAEIAKCRNHVQTCEGIESLGPVLLTGALARERRIVNLFQEKSDSKIILWNPFDALLNEPDEKDIGYRFVAALGASIKVG